jgi:hypothetical protein
MSDIRPDILEMIKEEQKVSTQHHVDNMLVANLACSSLYMQYTLHMQACTIALRMDTKDNQRAVQEKIVVVLPLKVHKHEIFLNFFLPKSNPYMPLVNCRKKFSLVSFDFCQNFEVQTFTR